MPTKTPPNSSMSPSEHPGLKIKTAAGLLVYFYLLTHVFNDDERLLHASSTWEDPGNPISCLPHLILFSLMLSALIWLLNRYGVFRALVLFAQLPPAYHSKEGEDKPIPADLSLPVGTKTSQGA